MHLYFYLRGIIQATDVFKMFMQTQMWKWEYTDLKDKKKKLSLVQGSLRECGFLYEYVFPEECFDEVCTMLNRGETFVNNRLGWLRECAIRKMLGHGVKPIPKWTEVPTNKYIEMRGIAIYPIGVKYDKVREVEEWGRKQEML